MKFVAHICFALYLASMALLVSADTRQPSLPNKVTDDPLLNSRFLLRGSDTLRRQTLRWAARKKRTDMVAAMIISLRYIDPEDRLPVANALKKITKQTFGEDWFRWIKWQQANPQFKPFEGFDIFLTGLLRNLDPEFEKFIYPGVLSQIRMEEILWGGVAAKDGIPPLTNPRQIAANEAHFLTDKELVFGIEINGDARAYPYRFMDWHEMLNDVVGGQAVSLAYCTLCGSGILFATERENGTPPFSFGSSGLLYRSNKLMFDYGTQSLWNQFTGEPVVGELANTAIKLKSLPLVTTRWQDWRQAHPKTKVLAMNTGFERNYKPGKPYGAYFSNSKLMFPVNTTDKRLKQKEQVFGLRMSGAEKAWPLKLFKGGKVINDRVGVLDIVLVGNAKSKSVRAYRSDGGTFTDANIEATGFSNISSNGQIWHVREDALYGPNGEALGRLPGHLAYWFAWNNYLGDAPLYE